VHDDGKSAERDGGRANLKEFKKREAVAELNELKRKKGEDQKEDCS